MALDDYKIQESDYTGKDVSGLPNRPALSASALKARFDSLVKTVLVPKYNALIDALKSSISGLVAKVSGGTTGNLASLTSDGSVSDSGKNVSDFDAAGTGASAAASAVAAHNTADAAHNGYLLPVTEAVTSGTIDLDDYTEEGTYYFPSGTTTILNIPDGSNGWLKVIRRNQSGQDETIKQLWWRHGTAGSNDWQTWVRVRIFGTWSAWSRYMTDRDSAGNIALGTGAIGATANLPVFTGASGVLETKAAESARNALGIYTYHGNVTASDLGSTLSISWAKTDMAYSVNRNDYHVSAGSAATQACPINVSCVSNGTVKVLWDRMVGDETVTAPVTIIGIET